MKLEIELVELKGVGRLHQEHFTLRTEDGIPLVEFCTTVPHGFPYIKVHAGKHTGKSFSVDSPAFAQSLIDSFVETADERVCRVCGCTDEDCSQCIEKTGSPCHWVAPDLCSACA